MNFKWKEIDLKPATSAKRWAIEVGSIYIKTKQKKKQLQKSPREAFAAFSGEDIVASVSKQNNKTSQPVVVNFLFASIDSISFSPSETAAAALHRWKQGNKTGGNRGSERSWRWSASGRKAIEDLTSTKKTKKNLDEVNLNCCGRVFFFSPPLAWQSVPAVKM